jgi:hypothetical protein
VYTVSTTSRSKQTKTQSYRKQFPGKLGTGARDTALKTAAKPLTDQQVEQMFTLLQALLQTHLTPLPLHPPPQQDSHLDCLVPREHQNSQ